MISRERVQWTETEWSRFLMAARFFGPPKRGDTDQVYKAAQLRAQVRPRPFDPATASKMNKARATPLSDGSMAKSPEPAQIEPVAVVANEELPAPTNPPEVVPEVRELPIPSMSDLLAEGILRILYHPQIRAALRDIVRETMAPESELEQQQAITWRKPKLGERNLRVTIVGGFGHHQLAAIPGIDLRLWGQNPGESLERLRSLLHGSDVAAVVIGRVPHAAREMVKARAQSNGLKSIYWDRGLPELRAELVKLVQEGKPCPSS